MGSSVLHHSERVVNHWKNHKESKSFWGNRIIGNASLADLMWKYWRNNCNVFKSWYFLTRKCNLWSSWHLFFWKSWASWITKKREPSAKWMFRRQLISTGPTKPIIKNVMIKSSNGTFLASHFFPHKIILKKNAAILTILTETVLLEFRHNFSVYQLLEELSKAHWL